MDENLRVLWDLLPIQTVVSHTTAPYSTHICTQSHLNYHITPLTGRPAGKETIKGPGDKKTVPEIKNKGKLKNTLRLIT